MNIAWLGAFPSLLLIVLIALIIWAATDAIWALLAFAAILLLFALHHLRHLASLLHWARQPIGTPVPEASGIWAMIFSALNRRARSALALREELTATLQRFRDAGHAMPDGVIILDQQNAIEWFNGLAQIHFGLNPERDIGATVSNLLRQPDFVIYLESDNYAEPLTLHSTRNIGQTLALQIVEFGSGQKLLLSRDITQFVRAETMRRDFVANVSHELKTPLTVVIGFLETLLDQATGMEQRVAARYLQMAMDQSVRMQRLVDDLLTLSALESGSASANDEQVDMQGLLADVLRDAEALSAGRHKIETDFAGPITMLGSMHELRSAFGNLASNAVNYTPQTGTIRLHWRTLPDGGAEFSVEDSGIGIEAQHIPRLTERFYRVDRSRSRETGGTGLGLAIVKHVLTRHQAQFDISSEPGHGSRFTARFPLRRVVVISAKSGS